MLLLQGFKLVDIIYKDKATGKDKPLQLIELHATTQFLSTETAQGTRSVIESIPLNQENLDKVKKLALPVKIEIISEKNYAYRNAKPYNTTFELVK